MPFANPQYLVDTEWLHRHLQDADLRIFDVTGYLTSKLKNLARQQSYDMGHIAGAVFLDAAEAQGELSRPDAAFPWTCPGAEQFEALMGRLGVDGGTQVVLYAATPRAGIDNGPMWCTRVWWVMHHFGVRVAILDGGWEKWVAENRPISTESGHYDSTSFTAKPGWERGFASKDDMLAALAAPESCVIDALSAKSFAGSDKIAYGPRKGHISGAVNLPMSHLIDPADGTFASPETMQAHLEASGALSAPKVTTYCGGGIAATAIAFGLALMGRTGVAVYDNSLFEWSADPSLPMSSGPSRDG